MQGGSGQPKFAHWDTDIVRVQPILSYAELSPDQLSRFYYERSVAYEFTRTNSLGYPVWRAVLEDYHKRNQKPKSIVELLTKLQMIWDSLLQGPIQAVKEFPKRLKASTEVSDGHFRHLQRLQKYSHNIAIVWMTL